MKSIVFCRRTLKEILRDPISYIFCLGFPIVMLVIMSIVNQSIPAEANMTDKKSGTGNCFFRIVICNAVHLYTGIQGSFHSVDYAVACVTDEILRSHPRIYIVCDCTGGCAVVYHLYRFLPDGTGVW